MKAIRGEFKKEMRYLVVKHTDMLNYLTEVEQSTLKYLAAECERRRCTISGRVPREYVIVESDWPEYDQTWEAIANRVREEELNEENVPFKTDNICASCSRTPEEIATAEALAKANTKKAEIATLTKLFNQYPDVIKQLVDAKGYTYVPR